MWGEHLKMAAFGTQGCDKAKIPPDSQHPEEEDHATPSTLPCYKNGLFFSSFDSVELNTMRFYQNHFTLVLLVPERSCVPPPGLDTDSATL